MSTNIRLVAVDMDGTLLDSRKNVPADFEQWVLDHPDILTVAASGRQYYTLKDMFPIAGDHLVYNAENGGNVFAGGKNIYKNTMLTEDVLTCLSEAEKYPWISPVICGVDSAYMVHTKKEIEEQAQIYYHHLAFIEDLRSWPERNQTIKVALYIEGFRAKEVPAMLRIPERLRPVVSGPDWVDISNQTLNKGKGIEVIQERYGISKEESMAFGDYMNDYTMLLACKESYAMANACPEIKEIASHETASNDEDGVMKVLRTL